MFRIYIYDIEIDKINKIKNKKVINDNICIWREQVKKERNKAT